MPLNLEDKRALVTEVSAVAANAVSVVAALVCSLSTVLAIPSRVPVAPRTRSGTRSRRRTASANRPSLYRACPSQYHANPDAGSAAVARSYATACVPIVPLTRTSATRCTRIA